MVQQKRKSNSLPLASLCLEAGLLWYVSDREGRKSFWGLKLAIWALLGLGIFWWTVFGWWKDFGRAFSRLDKKRAYLKVLI